MLHRIEPQMRRRHRRRRRRRRRCRRRRLHPPTPLEKTHKFQKRKTQNPSPKNTIQTLSRLLICTPEWIACKTPIFLENYKQNPLPLFCPKPLFWHHSPTNPDSKTAFFAHPICGSIEEESSRASNRFTADFSTDTLPFSWFWKPGCRSDRRLVPEHAILQETGNLNAWNWIFLCGQTLTLGFFFLLLYVFLPFFYFFTTPTRFVRSKPRLICKSRVSVVRR